MWAIFDADAVEREGWKVVPPYVDPDGYFFTGNTLAELAAAIKNEYQAKPMKGETLQATVERYNSFVDAGEDTGFRQAGAEIQNSNAAVLCRLGDAGRARHARRLENQRKMPGDRHERPGDSRSLLRRRVGRRIQSTWHGPLRDAGLYLPALTRRSCRGASRGNPP